MAVLETTILLILLVIISNIISHYMVFMPTALIEIALGVMAALLLNVQIELETDWFMLLFIAPLLYADAKHFPKKELWELRAPIFANAIWLVLLTTLLGGFLINFFIEEISLPLSFALAAVLSPTDPVAVQGIAEQVKLPKRLLSLISGESLINDASGLIAFKYALAAFLTGSFSVKTATTDFLYMAFIGMLVGLILSKLFYFVETILLRQGIQDVILHVSLQVLTPFIIFIAAEIFHASGVIAVVVAGVVSIQQEPLYRRQYSEIKLVSTRVWDIIIYQLNGIVFVVLGASLPFAMHSAIINPAINNWTLIRYVVIIWLILLIIRTLWSYGYMWFSYIKSRNLINIKPKFYTALLTGLTGVRGAVTMAMVLSIPFFLINGEIFKERYLIIFLASGVILTSLIVAVIALPFLTKKRTRLILTGDEAFMDTEFEETSVHSDLSEVEAKKLMTKKAINTLQKEQKSENQTVVTDILNDLDKQLKTLYLNDTVTSNELYHKIEMEYRQIAVQNEFNAVMQLTKEQNFPKLIAKNYLQMLKYKKRAHSTNFTIVMKQSLFKAKKRTKRLLIKTFLRQTYDPKSNQENVILLENESSRQAINALKSCQNELDSSDEHFILKNSILHQIILEYQSKIDRINNYQLRQQEEYQIVYQEYFLKTLDEERTVIQCLFEQGKISSELAHQLRQSLNYNESTFLQGTFDD
ncbi:cation:proton antiporter [Vagococcus carniphilus]|uniref:cation:proton antiporter n=1 Tax=Vagococcus carniphilus TaxID=218144 RepID=UPI002890504E|nr:cation:proton antiporter [Vagococcus carniphilus]MDT2814309.1 cation:proton antiporter [Vagococcus carniphilus]MDT2847823.1 cation:proton antiporter [Vagococcus carniphilus]MDT2864496.1 cation:proton antiporter [Vagococcus carniphilus]